MYILELQVPFIELAPNNYLKASLCSLAIVTLLVLLKSLHKPWTYLYNEPVVGLQNFVLSLIKGIFQPLCQHLHKTAGVDVVCWTDKPQYCGRGRRKRNSVKPLSDIVQYTFVLLITQASLGLS